MTTLFATHDRLEALRLSDQIAVMNELARELDNLRLALVWALQADIEAELRLASAILWFWHIRCHWEEEISWLEQGLEAEGELGVLKGQQGHGRRINEAADAGPEVTFRARMGGAHSNPTTLLENSRSQIA